jgi:hypothetical protein
MPLPTISSHHPPSSPLLSALPDESTTSQPPYESSRVHIHPLHGSHTSSNNTTGIKAKVENTGQYDEYVKELEPLREELGVSLKEAMYPDAPK